MDGCTCILCTVTIGGETVQPVLDPEVKNQWFNEWMKQFNKEKKKLHKKVLHM